MLRRFSTHFIAFFLCFCILFQNTLPIFATENTTSAAESSDSLNLSAASAILMEASTGTVLYEKKFHGCPAACQHHKDYDTASNF